MLWSDISRSVLSHLTLQVISTEQGHLLTVRYLLFKQTVVLVFTPGGLEVKGSHRIDHLLRQKTLVYFVPFQPELYKSLPGVIRLWVDGTPSRGEVAIRLSASCYWNSDKLRFTCVSFEKILTGSRQHELARRMWLLLSLVLHCQNVLWTDISEHACRQR